MTEQTNINTSNNNISVTSPPLKNGLDQNLLKYLAMFFMVLNHIGFIFLSDHIISDLLIGLGHFTFPTLCYFLVEGFMYTSDRKKYALRLLVFALISQIPFSIAFAPDGKIFNFSGLNVLFTLFICFLMIWGLMSVKSSLMRLLIFGAAFGLSYFCDWGLTAPIFTLIFLWAYGNKKNLKIGFLIILLLSILDYLLSSTALGGEYVFSVYGLFSSISGFILSGIALIWLYEGKRNNKHKQFNKWFFYIFYPAHLLILGVIRIILYC